MSAPFDPTKFDLDISNTSDTSAGSNNSGSKSDDTSGTTVPEVAS